MKSILNPVLKSCLALVTMLSLTDISQGQLINVNFTGGGDSPLESTLSGPAGGLGTTWNSVAAVSTGALNDSTGAATTVTVGTDYSNTTLGDQASGTLPVFRSFLNTFGRPNGNNVTINGLASGGIYDIWLLSYRDVSTGSPTERNVGTWTTSNTTTSLSSQSVNSQTGSPGGTAFQAGYNYVLFENVEATVGGVISFTGLGNGAGFPQDGNSRRIHLNGLQIEKTTPPVAGVVDDAMSTVDASPATVFADGVLTSTVTVTLRDANGIGVPGKEVTLANTSGPQAATINPLTAVTTNLLGQAVFNVSSGTPGIEVFTATDVTDPLTLTDTASVEFVEVGVLTNAAQSTVVASPSARPADGSSTSTITVTLRDANGYPVSAKNVTLANSGGPQAAAISPAGAVASDINGQAEFSVSSSTIGVEEFTATDTTDSIAVTQIATVSFIDPNAPKLINVNFTGGTAETESTLSGPTGGLGTAWNQFLGPNTSGTLVDSTGVATSVAITSNFNLPATFDGAVINLPMLRGSMTNFGKGADDTNVTISGLAPGGYYNIWMVTLRNNAFGSDGTEQYVGWWSTTNATTSPSSQLVNAVGPTVNTSTFVDGYNYVRFENVAADSSGNIVFTGVAGPLLDGSNNNHRLGLNGLQIQETGPPPLASYGTWSGGAPADGDANNDGVQNAAAWVLGAADPDENAIGLIPTLDNTSDPDFFIFNYHRSDTANGDSSTAIKVEYSSDLVNWPDAVAGPDIVITPFDEAYAIGIDRVEVKIRRTLAVGGKLFARLNVEVTP